MEPWHDFYMTAGGASAALIGLLFVGLSIHLETVITRPDVRQAARGSFQALIAILVASLISLIPQISSDALGWSMVALGVSGMVTASAEMRRVIRGNLLLGTRRAIRRSGTRVAGLILLLVVGGLFLGGQGAAPLVLMVTIFVLLGSSAYSTWNLLIDVAQAKKAEQTRSVEITGEFERQPVTR